jgi:cell division protein ZapA (FtsZ GTPase activity inhibitor)
MTIIDISIGKSKYKIDCPESQEPKLISLASKVNERVNNLSLLMRGAEEKMLLVLCAIAIEDELEAKIIESEEAAKLKTKLQTLEKNFNSQLLNKSTDNSTNSSFETYDKISKKLNQIADFIEKLAIKIKNS